MGINKKVTIPLVLILLIIVAGAGILYWQKKHRAPAETDKTAQGPVQYTCAMHPFIIKDSPGTCPICGMQLIKKVEGSAASAKEQETLGQVAVSPTQRVMANVGTVKVTRRQLSKEIVATGIVQYDQSRQAKVTAWVAGRIDRLHVDTVGEYISKGRAVAEVYSPDLVAAQQEYLLALRSREKFKNSSFPSIARGGEGLVSSARQRLKLLGVTDAQIAALQKGGEPDIRIAIYTPLSGVVIEKLVQEGQYVNLGDPLFSIADLSRVWVEVALYENEFSFVKPGQTVTITSQSYPGTPFTGRVSFIYPFLDPKNRTVQVRVELANPGLKLKPEMFVSAQIKSSLGSALAVPVSAVVDTGKRQVVWVEVEPGMFEPRDVQVGARAGDDVQIISGLSEGEKVAATGGYLIDSESQLSGGGGHQSMPGMEPKTAPAPSAPATPATPAAPKGGSMNMDDMKM